MLQGSLDDFALDEMLTLLASTGKTGCLEVKGDRGQGTLRLHEGRLVDAAANNTANGVEPEDVLFELLRFSEGNFHFVVSDAEEGSHDGVVAEAVLAAEERLADWKTIEAVVPSLRHMVTPVRELPEDEITLDRSDWAALITIGSGCPVSAVCDELDLGEVEGSRRIKALIERGLVAIGEPKSTGLRRSGLDAVRAAASSAASSPSPAAPSTNPLPSSTPSGGVDSETFATASNGSSNGNGASPTPEMATGAPAGSGTAAPMAGAANPILGADAPAPLADAASANSTGPARGEATSSEPTLSQAIAAATTTSSAPHVAQPPAPTAADAATMPPPAEVPVPAADSSSEDADADADRAQPPHPSSVPGGPAPTSGLSTLAPAVRQPLDGGTNERSGGLLMRYLKNDD